MKIGVISIARKDSFFVRKWIEHYGKEFGRENLFLNIHGHDGLPDVSLVDVNVWVHDRPQGTSRSEADRWASGTQSQMTSMLFSKTYGYDLLIRVDIDEYLLADPSSGFSLKELLLQAEKPAYHALGLDMFDRPSSDGERFGAFSRAYSKPCIVTQPVTWAPGCHRVKRAKNVDLMDHLYLFHLALFSQNQTRLRMLETYSSSGASFTNRLREREALFTDAENAEVLDFETSKQRTKNELLDLGANNNRTGFLKEPNFSDGYFVKLPPELSAFVDRFDFT